MDGIGLGLDWMDLRVGGGIEHLTVLIIEEKKTKKIIQIIG